MVVDKLRHDGDGDSARALSKDLGNLLVLESNHVLPVHLRDAVLSQNAITGEDTRAESHPPTHPLTHTHARTHSPSCRGVLDNLVDLIAAEEETDMVLAVLLHRDGPLKGTVPYSHRDAFLGAVLKQLCSFVLAVASNHFFIDLDTHGSDSVSVVPRAFVHNNSFIW